jgi:signal peptidase II
MRKWQGFLVSLLIILSDFSSKYFISKMLIPYYPKKIAPFLNFTLVYNTGSAFSFLSDAGDWHHLFFTGFSSLMSVAIIVWIVRLPVREGLQIFSLSLILGGAIGNLIDRLSLGHVIDFIDVYYASYHWPVFNIADAAICVGAVLLFVSLNRNQRVS